MLGGAAAVVVAVVVAGKGRLMTNCGDRYVGGSGVISSLSAEAK